jgi:hypothetical protein
MDTLSLGLGASGVGCFVVAFIGFLIARGLRSRCLVAGNVISIDIHKATQGELAAVEEQRDVDTPHPTVHTDEEAAVIPTFVPVVPTHAPTHAPTHPTATHPPMHPSRIPIKAARTSAAAPGKIVKH